MQNYSNQQIQLVEDLGQLYPSESSKTKRRYGLYLCFCNKEFKAMTTDIKSKHTRSCGCLYTTQNSLTNHELYPVWSNMIARTTNNKRKDYKNYGGRSIFVCNRWLKLEYFIEDMYPSYVKGLWIDRIDNDKGYSFLNCRWVSQTIQQRNTRTLKSTNTSGYRGVTWNKNANKWRAQISVDSKRRYLGYFDDILEAATAYDKYVISNNLEHTINMV